MKLKCLKCGDVIKSLWRHDFVTCKCGACFVDGGDDYFRYGGNFESIEVINEESTAAETDNAKQ